MNANPQWDVMTARLLDYAGRASFDALPRETVHECKRRLLDAFASALGAYDARVSEMARNVASRSRGDTEASIWGSTRRSTPENAAFANGVMVRLLDISDTYLGKSRGHPSDMISGLVAVAEALRADGKSLINAIVLAYDVYCSFCDAIDFNAKGWDQPVYSIMGCTLGIAKIMKLSRDETGHALALALAPNMALAQSRRGHLSTWKGCAGANASRNAVFAAMLAQEGFTGPTEIFEGDGGLWHATGGRVDWPLPAGRHMIGETHIKALPVCYHGQSSVWAAIDLSTALGAAEIESVEVDTYATAVMMMGADASRWAPTTRETADHSLPYCVSIALLDGKVDGDSFADSRVGDAQVASLMRKVKVREDKALTARYPEGAPGRVTVRTTSGATHVKELIYPRGHARSPVGDADVERKFRDMARARLTAAQCDAAIGAVWALDAAGDVGRDIVGRLAT